MEYVAKRSFTVCLCAAFALILSGCSGGSSSGSASGSASNGPAATTGSESLPPPTKTSTSDYPDWAKAVCPPYEKLAYAGLENPITYVMKTTDDRDTVVAWYKAHVTGGSWSPNTETGDWSNKIGDVLIDINKYSVQDGTGAKTAIQMTKS